jgi:hypothetical protein
MAATMKNTPTTTHKCWELQAPKLQLSIDNNLRVGGAAFLVIDYIKHDHMMNRVHPHGFPFMTS